MLRLPSLVAVSCALAVSACAPNSPQIEARSEPGQAGVLARPEARICPPNRTLLATSSAPDCNFKRSDPKTVDPDGWSRLKVEYERQCYRSAEIAVRDRLRLLQAAIKCES
jgi:hypothetical protein